MAMILVKLKFC